LLGRILAEETVATGMSIDRLRAVVVGLGPGSFTGLRVGLATAKGLALGGGVPIYGTSSLAMLAASTGPGLVAPVIEARRGEIFAALYDVDASGHVSALIGDHATTHRAFMDSLWVRRELATVKLVGNAALACRELAASAGVSADPEVRLVAGLGILHVAARIRRGEADALGELAPRYMKLSEAERGLSSSNAARPGDA